MPTEGGQKFTDEVVAGCAAPTIQSNGRVKYEVADLGRNVGYDRNGLIVRGGTVIVEGPSPHPASIYLPNEVVTQYPS